jgi:hypothetical protein
MQNAAIQCVVPVRRGTARKWNFVQDNDRKHGTVDAAESAGLPPAARRALAEAEERRSQQKTDGASPKEVGGRGGKDPARYGDWEINGRAIDF